MTLLLNKYCVHKPINKPVIIADNNNHGKYIVIAKVFVINIAIIICPILCAQAPNILTIKIYFSSIYPDDWLENGTRNGFRQEYNLNITGGNEKYSLMATLGYLDNEGLTPSSNLKRVNARIKANYQAYSFLRVGANASYTNTNSDNLGEVLGI